MKIPPWVTAQVATLAAVGALSFLLVAQCNRSASLKAQVEGAKAALQKADESHRLEVAGIQEANAVEADELRKAKNSALEALNASLEALKVKSRPIVVVRGSTGPVTAGGALPPGPAPVAGGGQTLPPDAPPAQVCLLRPGDKGEIRVTGAAVKTQAGNVAVEADAEAWRLEPDSKLFGGPLHLEVKYQAPPAPAREVGWGGGLALAVGSRGWAAGPAVASPPLHLWRLQLEPSAGLTLGPQGEFVGVAQVIGRIR